MTNAAAKAITLTVANEPRDEDSRVRLPDNVRTQLNILTGDRVVVSGDNGTITLQTWHPETLGEFESGTIPLTEEQRNALGVETGDEIQLSPADPRTSELFDGSQSNTSKNRSSIGSNSGAKPRTRSDGGAGAKPRASGGATDSDDSAVNKSEGTGIQYEDVGGLDKELDEIREAIELPLHSPEMFDDLGIDPPKGVLMYGPPGTGKTLIAKSVANEVDAQFFHVNGPEIMSKYKGESEQKLRDVFTEARQEGDAIIFFDEIDSFASQRGEGGDDGDDRVVAQLLSLMDGMDSQENVVVIGATNRVNSVDPALRRGGRFDREVEIGVPDENGRQEIFEIHTGNMPLADDVTVDELAERTHGFVGADIAAVCRESAMEALRRCKTEDGDYDTDREDKEVHQEDFNRALSSVEPSAMREFVAEDPDMSYDQVGGLEDAKTALQRNIEWPLKHKSLFEETATDPSPGVMLHGPSGSGKTMLARALAGESDVNFIHVNSTELIDKYVGESEKAVREVFQRARQAAPSIIFLDDIDGVASKYDDTDVTDRVVGQINTELDAVRENPNVTALAATQNPEDIDENLVGTGRFEELIELSLPDQEERVEIFEIHATDKPLADDVDIEEIASNLEGVTGSDIEAVVRESAMLAIEEAVDESGIEEATEDASEIEITRFHFETAMQNHNLRD